MTTDQPSIERRAARIKLLLMDCDGVLTDGRIWLTDDGTDQKSFNTHDGLGLALLHRAGLRSGVISGRTSSGLEKRAGELQIEFVRQGDPNKTEAFEEILRAAGLGENEVAFVGDDLTDIPLMLPVPVFLVLKHGSNIFSSTFATLTLLNYWVNELGGVLD